MAMNRPTRDPSQEGSTAAMHQHPWTTDGARRGKA